MATPTDNSYSVASGGDIYAGVLDPIPSWIYSSGVALNKTILIPGVSDAGGSSVHVFSGYAVDKTNSTLYVTAAGGHNDSYDNRCVDLRLGEGTPAWRTLLAATPFGQVVADADFYADGNPNSRHTYNYSHWSPSSQRVIHLAGFGTYANANATNTTIAFDPDLGAWEKSPNWPNPNAGEYGVCIDHIHNQILTIYWRLFDVATKTFLTPSYTGLFQSFRYPVAYDTLRDQFFSMKFGEGDARGSSNPPLNTAKLSRLGGPQTVITFNPSAALTQLLGESHPPGFPNSECGYAGMDYDNLNDCFYWYSGYAGRENHLYVVRPNNTSVWDIELFPFAVDSVSLPTAIGAGINGRLKFLPALKGFVISPTGGAIYFVKTAV